MFTAILQVFGRILLWIYNFCGDYALSLAIFTLLIRLVLFPLSYKSKKGMMQMTSMNEETQRLQKQYGKDQQRYQQEVAKLYEQEHVNPMGGCLWSLLPLPILMGLYAVIRQPMLHMLCLTQDEIATVTETLATNGLEVAQSQQAYQEMVMLNWIGQDQTLYNAVADALGSAADKLQVISFNFFGINLGEIPDWQFWTWDTVNWAHIGLFLIPIGVTVLNFLYSMYSMKSNQIKTSEGSGADNPAAGSTKAMMYLMPLMYLWFGYSMPAGMCIYMACTAIFGALENLIFSKFLNKKFAAEAAERQARIEARRAEEKAHKAEIAARRAKEEEEMRKKGGKRALKQAQKAQKKRDSGAGQVGVRRYARGRSYDPDRYPITPYRDPQDVLDEEALELALAKKRGRRPAAETEEEETDQTVQAVETLSEGQQQSPDGEITEEGEN